MMKRLHPILTISLFSGLSLHAGNVIDLNNTSAVFDISTPTTFTSLSGLITDGNDLAMESTFTPVTADLSGTVLLIEIGGATNGSALYLIEGVPTFVSKISSTNGAFPNDPPGNDLSGSELRINHSGGALSADTQYSVGVIANFTGNELGLAVSTGSGIIIDAFASGDGVSVSGTNWSGNDTVSYLAREGADSNMGASTATAGKDTTGSVIASFAGTAGQGLIWNSGIAGASFIPEPSAFGLLAGLMGLSVVAIRRRRA